MEIITSAAKLLDLLFKAYKKYEEFKMGKVFRRLKIEEPVEEFMVYPEDAIPGEEIRLVFGFRFKVETGKFENPIRLREIHLRIPKQKKTRFLWRFVPDENPAKWEGWREFDAITPREAEKHSGKVMPELYEIKDFFPKKENEIFVLEPSKVYSFYVAFDVKRRSPYNRPCYLVFYDDFDEEIAKEVIHLKP